MLNTIGCCNCVIVDFGENFQVFTKSILRKFLVNTYLGRLTLQMRKVLFIGNLPQGREVGVHDADCSADRTLSNGMSQ